MALEQTVGEISQRIHSGIGTFEKSVEQPRIFLDRLAHNLDWIKHVPILLATIYGKIKP